MAVEHLEDAARRVLSRAQGIPRAAHHDRGDRRRGQDDAGPGHPARAARAHPAARAGRRAGLRAHPRAGQGPGLARRPAGRGAALRRRARPAGPRAAAAAAGVRRRRPARPFRGLLAGLPGRRSRAGRHRDRRPQPLRHGRRRPRPHALRARRPGHRRGAARGRRPPRAGGRGVLRPGGRGLRRAGRRRARPGRRARRCAPSGRGPGCSPACAERPAIADNGSTRGSNHAGLSFPQMKPTFEVQTFEQVPAGPGTVLLRIAGRWVGTARERLPPPLLLVDDGRRTHRLSPLPGPDDSAPMVAPEGLAWRAAFTAPTELIAGRTAFALEAGRAGIVDLPRPTGRGATPAPLATPPAPGPLQSGQAGPDGPTSPSRAPPASEPPPGRTGLRRRRPTFEASDLARAADVAALEARLAEEREARETAERRANEAAAIARQAAAEAQRAADLAGRAEAARAGAVDALTDERMRASERASAEEERARQHVERATRAAEQARRAIDVAQEARRALEEREGEI